MDTQEYVHILCMHVLVNYEYRLKSLKSEGGPFYTSTPIAEWLGHLQRNLGFSPLLMEKELEVTADYSA